MKNLIPAFAIIVLCFISLNAYTQSADIGLIGLEAPVTGCGLTSNETVTIELSNYGPSGHDSIPLAYQLQGGPVIADTLIPVINPGDTVSFNFSVGADFSAIGPHGIDIWIDFPLDTNSINDSLLKIKINNYPLWNSFPFNYDVEAEFTCATTCGMFCTLGGGWINYDNDMLDWTVDVGGTPSQNTGPLVDNTLQSATGKYLYMEASNTCFPSKDAILLSQCIDMDVMANPFIEFAYHMHGIEMGDLFLEVESGGVWTTVFSLVGEQQATQSDPWLIADVDLSAFSGIVKVRFRGVTGIGWGSDIALDDIRIYDKIPNDVGITNLLNPVTNCNLDSNELLMVEVTNFGTLDQPIIPLGYSINGSAPVVDTLMTNLAAGATGTFVFSIPGDFSSPGPYSVSVWTALPADVVANNDSLNQVHIENLIGLSTFPLVYDIENESVCATSCNIPCPLFGSWVNIAADAHDWIVDEGGTGSTNTGPLVDNTTGINTGNYLYLEASGCNNMEGILESPCLNLDSLASPSFSFAYHMYGANMGDLFVEVDTGGVWVNVFSISGQQHVSESEPWSEVEIDLAAYKKATKLRIRGVTGPGFESDIAIDDLILFDKPPFDVGVIAFSGPVSGYALSATESVTMGVKNLGTDTVDSIPVGYSFDGGVPVLDTIFTLLAPGDTIWHLFSGSVNLSSFGTYLFDGWTSHSADMNNFNDSLIKHKVENDSTLVFGTGMATNTATGYPAPYGNRYTCAKHQILIRASEISAYGIASSGYIHGLAFNVFTANGVPLQDFEIKMKNTQDTMLGSAFDEVGLTTVWGPQSYQESNGWNWHSFSAPFLWDGTSNLLIETCFCNGTNNNSFNASSYYTFTPFVSTSYYRSDIDPNTCTNAPSTFVSYFRPDVKLDFELNTMPPTVGFTADVNVSCLGGPVQFSDLSSNYPNAWYWDFGDGNTDTSQNPIHFYTDTGTYTVMMVAWNNNGSDTLVFPDMIQIQNGAGVSSCNPEVLDISNGLGIYHVGLNTISNTTGNLQESYTDYSCVYFTTLLTGSNNTILVETGPQWEEDVRGWIDYNNDGIFDDLTELVLSSDSVLQYHSGEFFIPQGVVLDTMLRMRIVSDYSGTGNIGPCDTLLYGQSEDYGIIIEASTLPPLAVFNYTITDPCQGTVEFSDDSEYFPDNWSWDFGDGSSGSGSSITHTFGAGSFDVTLVASNSFGSDTTSTEIVIDSIKASFMSPGDTLEVGTSYIFLNESYGADTWTWDFGDGNSSSVEFPMHTFTTPGNYMVWLHCVNSANGCVDSFNLSVVVVELPVPGIESNQWNDHIAVYPSPSNGEIYFQYSVFGTQPVSIAISNVTGQIVFEDKLVIKNAGNLQFNLSELPKGVYLLTAILRAGPEKEELVEKSCKFIIE